jgi:hypothetical protein
MRWSGLVVLAACGAPVAAPRAPATPAAPAPVVGAKLPATIDRAPIDPIAALTPIEDGDVSWLAPGHARLEIDGAQIENPGGGAPIPVTIIDHQGNRVRLAVRLEHARFSLWTERDRLFAIMRHDHRVSAPSGGGGMMNEPHATLHAGARVKRLAHRGESTQVRYFGALEVEGWVPDAALGDAGPDRESHGRFPSGRRTLMVTPGAVIRAEPKWAADELAVMANGYFLDADRDLDDGWTEVIYEDSDLEVRGFVSRQLPPGQVHRPHSDPETQPVPITPNTKVASGTCLYSRIKGDPIGYIVGDREVDLTDAELGWYTLTIDSPWGPIAFSARGPTRSDLVACAPAGTVPAPAPPPPPTPPSVP